MAYIKEANLTNILFPNKKILIVGSPGSGKSVLIKDIFHMLRNDIGWAKVMSGTEEYNRFYKEHVGIPKKFIDDEYNAKIAHNFMKRQRRVIDSYMDKHKIRLKDNFTLTDHRNCHTILVMDDCAYQSNINDTSIDELIKNGRHMESTIIISMQYCMDFQPSTRLSIDVVFIFNEQNEENRKKLHKNFFGTSLSFKSFNLLMEEIVNNFTALVVVKSKTSNKFEDTVFYYKAKLRDNIEFGSEQFKKHY